MKTNFNCKKFALLVVSSSIAFGCAKAEQPASQIPAAWHVLPENSSAVTVNTQNLASNSEENSEPNPKLDAAVSTYVDATSNALVDAKDPSQQFARNYAASLAQLPDQVPWHMEYFISELGVSASGILGSLILKGTPSVIFMWRKQNPAAPTPAQPAMVAESRAQDDVKPEGELQLTNATSEEEMTMQLEPAIRAAVASGRVKDGDRLRKGLLAAAQDFQSLASTLGDNPGLEWWASRFRLDLTIDGSGKISHVLTVGGDLRFRFEWHRVMKKTPAFQPRNLATMPLQQTRLHDFVVAMSQDLSALSDAKDNEVPSGFKAYSFRVGIGVTAKKDIGVVKGTAGLIGHVYFSRDVAKPKVNPKPLYSAPLTSVTEIPVIEGYESPKTVEYALANGIKFDRETQRNGGALDQIVYKVNRKKIREGLRKAGKIASFFGKHASEANRGKWKVYELRTGFDLSVSGKVGMVELGGQATTQINFYNQNF